MRTKMTREQRKVATFLRHAIRDYGIPNFDVNSEDVNELAYEDDNCIGASYCVTVGANVVAIEYCCCRCGGDGARVARVYLNDYPLIRREISCIGDMAYVVVPFARMVQHLK